MVWWGYFSWMKCRSHRCSYGKDDSPGPPKRLPWMEGTWLDGGRCRCLQVMGPSCRVQPLASLSSAPCKKTHCFLGCATSIPWEPVELQSSVSMPDMRTRSFFHVATEWKTAQGLVLKKWEGHGCLMPAASQPPTLASCCCFSWPTKSRKKPKALFFTYDTFKDKDRVWALIAHYSPSDQFNKNISSSFFLKTVAWEDMSCVYLIQTWMTLTQ